MNEMNFFFEFISLGLLIFEECVVEVILCVYDLEILVNIYEFGFIYDVDVQGDQVEIKMMLILLYCFVVESLLIQVEQIVEVVDGIEKVIVEIVWDFVWNLVMMSDVVKFELGMF